MTERDSFPNGTPSWIDLGVPDPDAAADFYGGLFGWEVTAPTGDDGDIGTYRMCLLKGRPVAGIAPAQVPDAAPWWTTYVTVADADAAAKAVEAAGGETLVEPWDIRDLGRMAAFADPGGAAFSVWQPNQHHGSGLANEPGAFTWNELTVRDLDTTIPFYGAVFGWVAEQTDMGEGRLYTTWKLSADGRGIAGARPMVGDQWPADLPDHWLVYFAVEDCDAALARVVELGGTAATEPMDVANVGRFAVVKGPQGEVFAILADPS